MRSRPTPTRPIVKTLYEAGASFDVACMPEFLSSTRTSSGFPAKERQDFIWDKIIYANPIKDDETLTELDHYKPLVTYDNLEEIEKVQQVRARTRGWCCGSRCPTRAPWSSCRRSSARPRARPST